MGRHITDETVKQLFELHAKGYTRQRICNALHISDAQFKLQMKKAKKEFTDEHTKHGLCKLYKSLQGKKTPEKSTAFKTSFAERR